MRFLTHKRTYLTLGIRFSVLCLVFVFVMENWSVLRDSTIIKTKEILAAIVHKNIKIRGRD